LSLRAQAEKFSVYDSGVGIVGCSYYFGGALGGGDHGVPVLAGGAPTAAVPCDRCVYATHSPQLNQLKCTVHPELSYSEAAIACRDFCPQSPHP